MNQGIKYTIWGALLVILCASAVFANSREFDERTVTRKTAISDTDNSDTVNNPITVKAPQYYDIEQMSDPSEANPYVICFEGECSQLTKKSRQTPKPVADMPDPNTIKAHFEFNSAVLTENEQESLGRYLTAMNKFKAIELRGWTDPVGGVGQHNITLARTRADAVKRFLNNQGINKPIHIIFKPPCCNRSASASSPDSVRKLMRVVEVVESN